MSAHHPQCRLWKTPSRHLPVGAALCTCPGRSVAAPDALTPEELPGVSRRLLDLAEAAGWSTRATYVEGDGTRSTVVRLAHPDGHRAVAVWTGGKPDGAWLALAGWWWQAVPVSALRSLLADLADPRAAARAATKAALPPEGEGEAA